MYQIKVPGELRGSWMDWGEELTLTLEQEGENPSVTVLTGILAQAALHGLLRRLYSLGIPLISVSCASRCQG